jgi:hypothetical protein
VNSFTPKEKITDDNGPGYIAEKLMLYFPHNQFQTGGGKGDNFPISRNAGNPTRAEVGNRMRMLFAPLRLRADVANQK